MARKNSALNRNSNPITELKDDMLLEVNEGDP